MKRASDPPAGLAWLAKEIMTRKHKVAGIEEMWTLQTAPATTNGLGVLTIVFDWVAPGRPEGWPAARVRS